MEFTETGDSSVSSLDGTLGNCFLGFTLPDKNKAQECYKVKSLHSLFCTNNGPFTLFNSFQGVS